MPENNKKMNEPVQHNINAHAQQARKKGAIISAVFSTIILLLSSVIILFLRSYYQMEHTFVGTFLLLYSLIEMGMIIPVWILLKSRLKEIEGGEEDVAAQY